MDIEKVISDLGFPIAMSLASLWGAFYLIRYITGNLTELLVNRFEELRLIIIKLIDNSKQERADNKLYFEKVVTMLNSTYDMMAKLYKDAKNGK